MDAAKIANNGEMGDEKRRPSKSSPCSLVGNGMLPCAFDKLFTKSVPHILEKIFLSLDYERFKTCLKVSNAWKEMLTTRSFEMKRKIAYREEIFKDEKKLLEASEEGNAGEVRRIISSGMVDVNCVGDFQWELTPLTPLCVASKKGHKDVVQLLLDNGADTKKGNELGQTPLLLAAIWGRKDVVRLPKKPF